MPLHDISYQHWSGAHLGVWHRRWAIARNGLSAALQTKLMRSVLLLCWVQALFMAGILFVSGQLLVADSVVVQWLGNIVGPTWQAFARMLAVWMEQHPEISVHSTQNLVFYWFCTRLVRTSFFAVGLVIPLLFTRDLASNAIIVYSSKAISRWDYLLGKFGTAFGIMVLTWLGPVCAAWFLGNLLSPDWRFFWHARAALFHSLVFGVCAMTFMSLLALGASAFSLREKSTTALWYIWWSLSLFIERLAAHTDPWLNHLSLNYNLNQIALAVFRLGDDLRLAQENIPVFGQAFRSINPRIVTAINEPTIGGSLLWLLGMTAVVFMIIRKRVKPE